jgi:hypothetical protein
MSAQSNTSQKGGAGLVIVAIAAYIFFGRGPDGLICKYLYPSAYTTTETGFWNRLAGCDCRQRPTPSKQGDGSSTPPPAPPSPPAGPVAAAPLATPTISVPPPAPAAPVLLRPDKPRPLRDTNDTSNKEEINSQFRIAAGLGRIAEVRSLLERGADVNSTGPGTDQVPAGGTALMLAAARNQKDVVRLLLSKGGNPNQADKGGGTALIYASWKGNLDIVKTLLESGADVNATTRDGRTPLTVARNGGHSEIVSLLERHQAKK